MHQVMLLGTEYALSIDPKLSDVWAEAISVAR